MNTKPKVEIERQTKDPEEIKTFLNVLRSMADRILLADNKITNVDVNQDGKIDGYQFDIANPFYTAEAISSITTIKLTIDGREVNPKDVSIMVRGQRVRLDDAYTFHELFWGFGEVISVFVEDPKGLPKGEHQLDCTLKMRTTITYGFPGGLLFPARKKMITT